MAGAVGSDCISATFRFAFLLNPIEVEVFVLLLKLSTLLRHVTPVKALFFFPWHEGRRVGERCEGPVSQSHVKQDLETAANSTISNWQTAVPAPRWTEREGEKTTTTAATTNDNSSIVVLTFADDQ